ncbi:MAG TPA: DUF58 domain-containing protein [Chloroflexota bacterium]|nr:DUF58 domain-containing protein [Chloroflexota bacterium]
MSALKVLTLTIVVAALAVMSGQLVLFHLTDVLIATLVLSALWSWLSVRGLRLSRTLRQDRAQVGGVVEQRVQIRSTWPFPRLWIEFTDQGTLPDYYAGRVFDLGISGQRSWNLEAPCRRRGLYEFGPARVASSDPFGFFRTTRQLGPVRSILVYPATVDVAGLTLPAGQLFGGDRRRTGWHQTTPHVSGTREYQPGDPVRHVHWRSTAHAGRLMVKEFDLEPIADIWLILDLHAEVQRGEGDDSTEEYGVTIAASLARHFLKDGRSVGLIGIASQHLIVPADRSERQLRKVLEELAVVHADGREPIAETLAAESNRCSKNAAIIVVTPSLDERWPSTLRGVRDRGIQVGAVALEPSTFGDAPSSLLLVSSLATCGIPSILVKCGDQLDRVLSVGWRG